MRQLRNFLPRYDTQEILKGCFLLCESYGYLRLHKACLRVQFSLIIIATMLL